MNIAQNFDFLNNWQTPVSSFCENGNSSNSSWIQFKKSVQLQVENFTHKIKDLFVNYCLHQKNNQKITQKQSQQSMLQQICHKFDQYEISTKIQALIMKNLSKKVALEKSKRRAEDPEMQKNLERWILMKYSSGQCLSHQNIKEKARQISQSTYFKASKGWLQRFYKRFPHLKLVAQIIRKTRKQFSGVIDNYPQQIYMNHQSFNSNKYQISDDKSI